MKKIVKVFARILIVLGVLVLLIAAWVCFSALNRDNSVSHIPEDYSIVLHADSVYDGLSPLIDLKAVDTILAEPSFSTFRGAYMKAREVLSSSSLLWNLVLSRCADFALYDKNDYVAVVDLSWLSSATRLANPLGNIVSNKIEKLDFNKAAGYFEYNTEKSKIYICFYKNLALISSDELLFSRSKSIFENEKLKQALGSKKSNQIKVIADAKKVAQSFLSENATAAKLLPFIEDESLTLISFSLTNEDIDLKLNLPFKTDDSSSRVAKLLRQTSSSPSIFSRLTDGTQYFTLLNLCSIDELVETASEIYPEKNIPGLLESANGAAKTLIGASLDDLFFSWTGNEVAVLGLQDSSTPVFCFQIKDEKKLRTALDKMDKSLVLNNNTSLILGGMRLSCLELPSVFSALVSAFGYNVPRVYYLIQDGYIYFSEAPQNLSNIFSRAKKNHMFSKNLEWREISKKMGANSSFSVYYDLKRSLPFFIDSTGLLPQILKMYNLGRCDLLLKNGEGEIHLHAVYSKEASSKLLAGFPVKTGKPQEYSLEISGDTVYHSENGKIVGLNLQTLEQKELQIFEKSYVLPASDSRIWVLGENGTVNLLDKNFKQATGFPVITGTRFSAKGSVHNQTVYIPTSEGNLAFVRENGEFGEIFVNDGANFRGSPAISENGSMALYSRGFEGEIYLFENEACVNANDPIIIDGVGFGSPCIVSSKKQTLVSFLTQSGDFYVFDQDGSEIENFPIVLDDVFYMNAVFYESAWYALSEKAVLYRISKNGSVLAVQLPDTTSAKEGIITVSYEKGKEGIYVSGDSNLLFAFNKNLELIDPFPVSGRGKPVFYDVNKDGYSECISLSSTREISAWNVE